MITLIPRVLYRFKDKGRSKHYRLIKNFEYTDKEKILSIQRKKLFSMLMFCKEKIPYYKNIIAKNNYIFAEKTIFTDLTNFPVLTKDIIRNNFERLQSIGKKDDFYKNTSGGSTGEPVVFIQDKIYNETGKGAKMFFDEWAGLKQGGKLLRLWGSERDILEGSVGFYGWFMEHIMNVKTLNAFRMSEKGMKIYIASINKFKPDTIEAYAQSIFELANFSSRHKLKVFSPRGIITSAGTLYPEMKEMIQSVFRCPVFNQYGSRETGLMAFSCGKNDSLHLNMFNNYIEILDINLKPCKPNVMGKIYVTTLNNYCMPLIRYEIGDLAVPSNKKICSCGRGLLLIKKIEGREMSVFKTSEGKIVPGEFFIHFIGVVYNKGFISKFQVIQKNYDRIEIRIVIRDWEKFYCYQNKIEDSIRKVMGNKCIIEWKFVDEIEPLKSGKYIYTISEVK